MAEMIGMESLERGRVPAEQMLSPPSDTHTVESLRNSKAFATVGKLRDYASTFCRVRTASKPCDQNLAASGLLALRWVDEDFV
jgi:hypothetical protein